MSLGEVAGIALSLLAIVAPEWFDKMPKWLKYGITAAGFIFLVWTGILAIQDLSGMSISRGPLAFIVAGSVLVAVGLGWHIYNSKGRTVPVNAAWKPEGIPSASQGGEGATGGGSGGTGAVAAFPGGGYFISGSGGGAGGGPGAGAGGSGGSIVGHDLTVTGGEGGRGMSPSTPPAGQPVASALSSAPGNNSPEVAAPVPDNHHCLSYISGSIGLTLENNSVTQGGCVLEGSHNIGVNLKDNKATDPPAASPPSPAPPETPAKK